MTDLTQDSGSVWTTRAAVRNRKRRYAADRRLRLIGAGAIGLAMVLLGTLIFSIVATGWPAFLQTRIVLEVDVDPQHVDGENAARGNFRALVQERSWRRCRRMPGMTSVRRQPSSATARS
jgi:phosphate transport system permease protein